MTTRQIDMLRESLHKQTALIEQAISDVQQGRTAQLTGMETKVNTLCQNIIAAGKETGMALEKDMQAMIAKLGMLENILNARTAQLREELKNGSD